jgi:hypothetical protein
MMMAARFHVDAFQWKQMELQSVSDREPSAVDREEDVAKFVLAASRRVFGAEHPSTVATSQLLALISECI